VTSPSAVDRLRSKAEREDSDYLAGLADAMDWAMGSPPSQRMIDGYGQPVAPPELDSMLDAILLNLSREGFALPFPAAEDPANRAALLRVLAGGLGADPVTGWG
jgi:hypothetical protein